MQLPCLTRGGAQRLMKAGEAAQGITVPGRPTHPSCGTARL